jgi:threonine dehydratase
MADLSKCPPLTRASVEAAHRAIESYIHKTPVLTCETLSTLASGSRGSHAHDQHLGAQVPAQPRMKLFFKCENYQRVGAFKARGAFHALSRLTDEELKNGVVTHSSGKFLSSLRICAR